MELIDTPYRLVTSDNEYHNIDYQMVTVPAGRLQYRETIESILTFDIDNKKKTNKDYNKGYELENHSSENLARLIPNTSTGNQHKKYWKILLLIKCIDGDKICLKGALIHSVNKKIAFISSINTACQNAYSKRLIKSYDSEYKICHCKMIAPLLFWDELRNRLIN
jgi:hypothetical protein